MYYGTLSLRRVAATFATAISLLVSAPSSMAKPWKGAELITYETFKFGAIEARIRGPRGSGFSTAFFLWRDGSESQVDHWQEQDFETFGKNGGYQTQAMTPGRTEHNIFGWLPTAAWERYYTYRMEWTPNYIAYYIDGQLIRRETDKNVYAKFLDPNQAEPAQLRVNIWAGNWEWSGAFDSSVVPQATFVNWIQTYRYTPGAGSNGGDFTPYWRDDFDSLNSSRWWRANWTFDLAVNDFVPQNVAAQSGTLVFVFTDQNNTGRFPAVPADDGQRMTIGPPVAHGPFTVPARIEAEAYSDYAERSPGNFGGSSCGVGDVDVELTTDPAGGYCNIGWTEPGEWLDYDLQAPRDLDARIVLRLATNNPGKSLHLELDGRDVSGALAVPVAGWQSFSDLVVHHVRLSAGAHVLRLVFDTGEVNVNYLEISEEVASSCTPSIQTYQAESIAATTGVSTGDGWNLWTNGALSFQHSFRGLDTIISVRCYGQLAQNEAPHMVVRVGSRTVGAASVDATDYRPYDFFYQAPAGSSQVEVVFDNDYFQDGEDRNLYVDQITIEECLE